MVKKPYNCRNNEQSNSLVKCERISYILNIKLITYNLLPFFLNRKIKFINKMLGNAGGITYPEIIQQPNNKFYMYNRQKYGDILINTPTRIIYEDKYGYKTIKDKIPSMSICSEDLEGMCDIELNFKYLLKNKSEIVICRTKAENLLLKWIVNQITTPEQHMEWVSDLKTGFYMNPILLVTNVMIECQNKPWAIVNESNNDEWKITISNKAHYLLRECPGLDGGYPDEGGDTFMAFLET